MNIFMEVIMGQMAEQWGKKKNIVQVTLCVTENCNLRCTYCYCLHKNNLRAMSEKTAYDCIDFILSDAFFQSFEGIIIDFIGGEPTLELDLIDKVCDYFLLKIYKENHKWFNMYRFMIGSNGLLYNTKKMQNFIKKHQGHLYVGLSIDGNKEKHNISRIKIDGSGSYEDIIDNVKLWINQYNNAATKSTFSHEDLPFLKDSIVHLWNLGIKYVHANIVYEDVWEKGDVEIFEEQLYMLADYIIENNLWNKKSVTFFSPETGLPISYEMDCFNACGAGYSVAIDCDGNLFPCHRFFGFTQKNSDNLFTLGNIYTKLDLNKMRSFKALTQKVQLDDECNNCEVAGGCGWCSGHNYSELGTIYQRVKYKCEMHKAQVRVNKYLWSSYSRIKGIISPQKEKAILFPGKNTKYMYILTDSSFEPICNYTIPKDFEHQKMSKDLYNSLLDYCDRNNFLPIIIGDEYGSKDNLTITHYNKFESPFAIYINSNGGTSEILSITKDRIADMSKELIRNIENNRRLNLIFPDFIEWDEQDLNIYEDEMKKYLKIVIDNGLFDKSINVINDLLNTTSMRNCNAGVTSFTVAPNGLLYLCPAFYYHFNNMGYDLEHISRNELCELKKAPLCQLCSNYTCPRCIYQNKVMTGELSVPTAIQCKFSNINRNLSLILYQELRNKKIKVKNLVTQNEFDDCMERLLSMRGQ